MYLEKNLEKAFSLTFHYNILKNDVPNWINKITEWKNLQFLKINQDKTDHSVSS